ncbi:MAG TPA: nickel-binding protein [Candidatus Eremiobacteraceae bacterium]|nr:nickel-binding protein [Candidatus Eremiobacteraceae bacterium]
MKYFIDTHDRTKGSWPKEGVSEAEFIEIYAQFEKALEEVGGADLGAHVNVPHGKAFCFTKGENEDAIRRAHEKLNFPYDSITEVRRVTGVDLRLSEPKKNH